MCALFYVKTDVLLSISGTMSFFGDFLSDVGDFVGDRVDDCKKVGEALGEQIEELEIGNNLKGAGEWIGDNCKKGGEWVGDRC